MMSEFTLENEGLSKLLLYSKTIYLSWGWCVYKVNQEHFVSVCFCLGLFFPLSRPGSKESLHIIGMAWSYLKKKKWPEEELALKSSQHRNKQYPLSWLELVTVRCTESFPPNTGRESLPPPAPVHPLTLCTCTYWHVCAQWQQHSPPSPPPSPRFGSTFFLEIYQSQSSACSWKCRRV